MHKPVAIVIYDGECGFCRGFAEFVRRHTRVGRLQLEPRLSAKGQDLLRERSLLEGPDSLVLIADGRTYLRSEAALRTARYLPLPWRSAALLLSTPRPIRDRVYDWVARAPMRFDLCTPRAVGALSEGD